MSCLFSNFFKSLLMAFCSLLGKFPKVIFRAVFGLALLCFRLHVLFLVLNSPTGYLSFFQSTELDSFHIFCFFSFFLSGIAFSLFTCLISVYLFFREVIFSRWDLVSIAHFLAPYISTFITPIFVTTS